MFIVFPLGLLATAVIFDIIYLDVNFISSLPVMLGSAYKAWVDSKLVQMVWGED